jgi:hypothetical protein
MPCAGLDTSRFDKRYLNPEKKLCLGQKASQTPTSSPSRMANRASLAASRLLGNRPRTLKVGDPGLLEADSLQGQDVLSVGLQGKGKE